MRQQSCNFVTDGVLSKLSSARAKYNNTTAIYGTQTANYIPLLIQRNTSKRISRDFTAVATVAFSFFQAQVRLGNPSLESQRPLRGWCPRFTQVCFLPSTLTYLVFHFNPKGTFCVTLNFDIIMIFTDELNLNIDEEQRQRRRGGETICPRRWQFDGGKNRGGSTSVRGRVRSPHISSGWRLLNCRQPACL